MGPTVWRLFVQYPEVMKNPWALYDDLIDGIGSVTVDDYQVGHIWTRVSSSDGASGLAMTTDVRTRPALFEGSLVGKSLRDAAALVKSWNLVEASIGLAAINSWYSHPGRLGDCGYQFPLNGAGDGAFDTYAEAVKGKKVATVGHFAFIEKRFEHAGELTILEREPRTGDYIDSAAEYLIPEQDFVFITGSTLVNKTLPRLLELTQHAFVVIAGPSTPMSPALYDHGANGLSGFTTPDANKLREAIRGTGFGAPSQAGIMVDFAKTKPNFLPTA